MSITGAVTLLLGMRSIVPTLGLSLRLGIASLRAILGLVQKGGAVRAPAVDAVLSFAEQRNGCGTEGLSLERSLHRERAFRVFPE